MSQPRIRYPVWVRGDLDGFFGLMVDNLVQVLLIINLCRFVAGLPDTLIFERILPGVAISLLVGNLFYGLQAHWVARRHPNPDCTALPYGINTPSVIAFVLFIMGPVYSRTGDPDLAWKAGLLACLVSGLIEFGGAFVAERLRRVTPRAALLGVLAGLAIAFIASDFAFRIYTRPLVGILPLGILLLAYFGRYRFPLGLPGGFLVVLFGTAIAWGTALVGGDWFGGVTLSARELRASLDQVRWIAPVFAGRDILSVLARADLLVPFLTVSVPMGVLNALGSLQNIESAEAAGDRFATAPSLAVNGLGTLAAGLFGSCFPTTIYIGHPAWKSMGAKAGYSILNGAFFTLLFLFGCGTFLAQLIPIEAGAAIVMYIGIIITAQAFQATPREHAPAVAIALFPALAAILAVKLQGFLADAHSTLTIAELARSAGPAAQVSEIPGILALFGANAGWLVTALLLAAIGVAFIERRYRTAAVWSAVATVLTLIGLLHSYRVEGNVIREYFLWQHVAAPPLRAPPPAAPATAAPDTATAVAPATTPTPAVADRAFPIAVGYALATLLFTLVAWREARRPAAPAAATGPAPPSQAPEPPAAP